MFLTITIDGTIAFQRFGRMRPVLGWAIERFDPFARAWDAVDAKRHNRGPNGYASIDGLPVR